jgi:hypothetical protein
MFDLINAQAEYQSQLKLFLKPTYNEYVDNSLRLYLEKNKELECFKIGRFINLDNNASLYCEWLYQYFKLQENYDEFFELFTKSQLQEVEGYSNTLIREYHKEYYSIIWPKVLATLKINLEHLKAEIIKKQPYLETALNSVENYVADFQCHNSISVFKNFSKNSFLQKGKFSLSYLKIGFPLYLGFRQDVIDSNILKPDSINWTELNEFLQSMCLIHYINNDDTILLKIAINDKPILEKFEALTSRKPVNEEEKSRITSSVYAKCKADLANITLLDKQKTILENILNWCYEHQDAKYKQY